MTIAVMALAALVLLCVGLPAIGVGVAAWRLGPANDPGTARGLPGGLITSTIIYTACITGLAVVLGIPAAWVLRSTADEPQRFGRWAALIMTPMLLPSTLAYSGWGQLRGPGSVLGDWLARGDPARAIAFDRSLAVVGLSLWVWPIAALVIATGARRIPGAVLDALWLEPASWIRRTGVVGRMLGGWIIAAAVLTALVMAGSAVPLHLAQAPTIAIYVWKQLTLTAEPARVVVSAWGLVVVMLVVFAMLSWVGSRRMRTTPPPAPSDSGNGPTAGRLVRVFAVGVWMLSVPGPLVVYAAHLRTWRSLVEFWRLTSASVWLSVQIGLAVGGLVAGIGVLVFAARSCGGRFTQGLAGCVVAALVAVAIMPGVIVGAGTLLFWNGVAHAQIGTWTLVLAHVARFGFVGAGIGWYLGHQESRDERDSRRLVGGDGLRAWVMLRLVPAWAALAGAGLAAMALSVHEIEATVTLTPPGTGTLAQRVLDLLHFARDEQLCAACINLLVIGTLVALAAGWLVQRGVHSAVTTTGRAGGAR